MVTFTCRCSICSKIGLNRCLRFLGHNTPTLLISDILKTVNNENIISESVFRNRTGNKHVNWSLYFRKFTYMKLYWVVTYYLSRREFGNTNAWNCMSDFYSDTCLFIIWTQMGHHRSVQLRNRFDNSWTQGQDRIKNEHPCILTYDPLSFTSTIPYSFSQGICVCKADSWGVCMHLRQYLWQSWKPPRKWHKCNHVWEIFSMTTCLVGSWTGWIGSVPMEWTGVVWALHCCDGVMSVTCCGVWILIVDLLFLVNSHFVHSLTWYPAWSSTCPLLHHCFPSNLSTSIQGTIVKLHRNSSEWCTLLCWSVWNSKPTLVTVLKLFWGMLGRWDGGLRSIGVSGSGYNEVLTLEVLNVVDPNKRKRHTEVPVSTSAPHADNTALLFQVCVRTFICTVTCCMCVCTFVHVCVFMNIHICIYLYVYMYGYTHASIYMCICLCIHVCVSLWSMKFKSM